MTETTIEGFRCIQTAAGRTVLKVDARLPFRDTGAVALLETGELICQVDGRHVVVPPAVVRWLLDGTNDGGGS